MFKKAFTRGSGAQMELLDEKKPEVFKLDVAFTIFKSAANFFCLV
jgi:hypothetical protein